ncbi:hypothetical protein KM043_012716 [Ampulex compressa]|nr:hypothetical protein KM043_012716 [Ampulex compressa]
MRDGREWLGRRIVYYLDNQRRDICNSRSQRESQSALLSRPDWATRRPMIAMSEVLYPQIGRCACRLGVRPYRHAVSRICSTRSKADRAARAQDIPENHPRFHAKPS